jgi:hypothetical protein
MICFRPETSIVYWESPGNEDIVAQLVTRMYGWVKFSHVELVNVERLEKTELSPIVTQVEIGMINQS